MRKLLSLLLKLAVSAGLLYLAMGGVNFLAIRTRLGQTDPVWIAAAVAISIVQVGVAALRWREVANACGAQLSIRTSLVFNLVGGFFGQTLPSTVGGDAARLWLLRQHGAGWQTAAYSVLVDRAVGLTVLSVIVAISLPWSLVLIGNEYGRAGLSILAAAAFACCFMFLVFGYLPWRWIQRIGPARHLHECARLARRALFDRGTGPKVLLLSVLNQLLSVVFAACIALAIAAPVSFGQLVLLIPPAGLITVAPISIAGWGVREQTLQVAFTYSGLNAADGVTISLLLGAVSFVVGALGGLAWFVQRADATGDVGEVSRQLVPGRSRLP